MTEILPRYEFRAFAQNFGMVETKVQKACKMRADQGKFRDLHHLCRQ